MTSVGRYILSIAAAAIVLALLRPLLAGKGAAAVLGKMVGGIFLLFTILRPISGLDLNLQEDWIQHWNADGSAIVSEGQQSAREQWAAIIKQQIEAYILEEAAGYHATLRVQVTLSDEEIPMPIRITIEGDISPYGKRQMQNKISENLGIAKEDQLWI